MHVYLDVESPLDQNRPGGEGPRPWADTPRYAWITKNTGMVNLAGLLWDDNMDPPQWSVVDVHIPVGSIIKLQTFQNTHMEEIPDGSNGDDAADAG